jgi:PAS domain S-box-containing protein
MVFVKDAEELRFVRFNRAGEKLTGLARGDVLGKSDAELFSEEQAAFFVARDREVLAGREAVDIPGEPIATPHGDRLLHTRKIPICDSEGTPRYLLGISEDITERKRAEDEIRTLNAELNRGVEELKAVNGELEAFSYSVSHDLRAPLRHILGFADLLKRHLAGGLDEKSRHFLTTIIGSAARMSRLIEDLLAFSRTGRTPMRVVRVDLRPMVDEVLRELPETAAERQVEWKIGELPQVQADAPLLRQVLVNLLSNALKYTGPTPHARIEIGEVLPRNGETVFFVRDNGVGFDMRYAEKLFGVFQRLHRAEEFEGTGIGLANVRRIIHRHGGRTWAEGSVGQGATFYFSLPVASEEAA